eukprot:CAMPEP_0168395402 /NCGR_PEP_ID=MMETSP0228-20121227/20025_1 /TAXON_ID=133427 /ORGANISM="Protoceratium reticulatum, Strain CCCM 535 (=CCMP 1889)" /LENGTH=691 /DNA_ID=CAMNT_0008408833 /DNA_START=81 /DNA_END=2156 /DNA_ORIENTATION=+
MADSPREPRPSEGLLGALRVDLEALLQRQHHELHRCVERCLSGEEAEPDKVSAPPAPERTLGPTGLARTGTDPPLQPYGADPHQHTSTQARSPQLIVSEITPTRVQNFVEVCSEGDVRPREPPGAVPAASSAKSPTKSSETLASARGFKVSSLGALDGGESPRRSLLSRWPAQRSDTLGPPPRGSIKRRSDGALNVPETNIRSSSSSLGSQLQSHAEEPVASNLPTRFGVLWEKTPQHKKWQHLASGNRRSTKYKNTTPLAKKKMETMLQNQTHLERLTKGRIYELVEAAAIILNALFIACDIQRKAYLAWYDNTAVKVVRGEAFLNVMADFFCCFFTIDLFLRLLADGIEFFRSREQLWNIFDFLVVGTAILESIARWHQYAMGTMSGLRMFIGKFSVLRFIRLLRIIRGTRAIRMRRFIRELSIMVYSITGAVKPLFWSVVLTSAMLLIFAVFFVDGAIVFNVQRGLDKQEPSESLMRFFETLPIGTASLFMAMSGGVDWREIWDALEPLQPEYRFVFLVFISFSILALLNVVTAVFVDAAIKMSQNDQELRVQQEVERKVEFIHNMQRIFEELDTNSSGTLTLEEFEKQMQDENVLTFMSTLELDVDQVRTLLMLLDRDQNGEVDIDEFITGCIRLKGGAKSLDMAMLQYQVEWMVHNVAWLSSAFENHFGEPARGPMMAVASPSEEA